MEDYYWEKAEFQDPLAHQLHVEKYKRGVKDSSYFNNDYEKEANDQLKKLELHIPTREVRDFLIMNGYPYMVSSVAYKTEREFNERKRING